MTAEALSNAAAAAMARQDFAGAEALCRAALQHQPGYWAALANLGQALHAQYRLAEAVPCYVAALNANPGAAQAWTNLGVAFREQWHMPGARDANAAALALAPDDPQIRANRAMALLTAGDYAEGFREFAARWHCPGMRPHGIAGPEWQGEALHGETILLHAEGGFGDTLQFVRYAPLLAARGGRAVLRMQEKLVRLLRRSFPALPVIAETGALPPYDLHCPMLSLPAAFGTDLDTVPAQTPYLRADEEAVRRWRARLATLAPPAFLRVGLVWRGSPLLGAPELRRMNTRRSADPACLAPLGAIPGLAFVSLQHEAGAEAPPFPCFDAMQAGPPIEDFDDTAALVAALDLVIGVDTAVIHLAGALGRPAWVLSRYDACWRWLAHRNDSPWYPGLRLFRQASPGDWDSAIAAAAAALPPLAAQQGARA